MKSSIECVVLLSCIALAASYAIDLKPAEEEAAAAIVPQNDGECASACLWTGVYNFPSFQNCRRYIHCVHGFQFDLECGSGEEFDHITLRCQPEARGRCALEGPVDDNEDSSSEDSSSDSSDSSSDSSDSSSDSSDSSSDSSSSSSDSSSSSSDSSSSSSDSSDSSSDSSDSSSDSSDSSSDSSDSSSDSSDSSSDSSEGTSEETSEETSIATKV